MSVDLSTFARRLLDTVDLQLRRKDYKAARLTLEQVIAGNPTPQMRVQAETMLNRAVLEEQNQPKQ
jgi:hypothetical protein